MKLDEAVQKHAPRIAESIRQGETELAANEALVTLDDAMKERKAPKE